MKTLTAERLVITASDGSPRIELAVADNGTLSIRMFDPEDNCRMALTLGNEYVPAPEVASQLTAKIIHYSAEANGTLKLVAKVSNNRPEEATPCNLTCALVDSSNSAVASQWKPIPRLSARKTHVVTFTFVSDACHFGCAGEQVVAVSSVGWSKRVTNLRPMLEFAPRPCSVGEVVR